MSERSYVVLVAGSPRYIEIVADSPSDAAKIYAEHAEKAGFITVVEASFDLGRTRTEVFEIQPREVYQARACS